jgi:hypothetical protein
VRVGGLEKAVNEPWKERSAHYEGVGADDASTERQGEAGEKAKLELNRREAAR